MSEYERIDIAITLFATYIAWFSFFITATTAVMGYMLLKKDEINYKIISAKIICYYFFLQSFMSLIGTIVVISNVDEFAAGSNHPLPAIANTAYKLFAVTLALLSIIWIYLGEKLSKKKVDEPRVSEQPPITQGPQICSTGQPISGSTPERE